MAIICHKNMLNFLPMIYLFMKECTSNHFLLFCLMMQQSKTVRVVMKVKIFGNNKENDLKLLCPHFVALIPPLNMQT